MHDLPPSAPSALTTDPVALATLLLSSGKYFVLSRVDSTMQADAGQLPTTINYAGVIRNHTPDYRYFLIDIFSTTEDFTTDESATVGKRLIRLEDLMKATFFSDFKSMQESAEDNYGIIESLNFE